MSKVVIVTGGGRGIGAATCKLLASRGYSVCVNYRANRARAEEVVSQIIAAGGNAFSFQADVSVEPDVAAQGIRVNSVRPGLIYTEIHADGGEPNRVARLTPHIPLQRGGTPEEVANAIAWLLSDEASYVTGSFIDLAGGR